MHFQCVDCTPITAIIRLLAKALRRDLMDHGRQALLDDESWTSIARTLRLSNREQQILRIVIEDRAQSDEEIGRILSMSPHTVHTHFERLYRKTAVGSRTGLVLRIFAEYVALAADA